MLAVFGKRKPEDSRDLAKEAKKYAAKAGLFRDLTYPEMYYMEIFAKVVMNVRYDEGKVFNLADCVERLNTKGKIAAYSDTFEYARTDIEKSMRSTCHDLVFVPDEYFEPAMKKIMRNAQCVVRN